MIEYSKLLNSKQEEACTYNGKYLRIIAGAGSGKTRVLTYRIAYLIEGLGYNPSSILAITFTNKAANEIKTRVQNLLNENHIRLNITTFHSYCARILREECKSIDYPSTYTIIDDEDQHKIIKNIIKDLELDEKTYKIKNCLDFISIKKNTWISPEAALKQASFTNYYKSNLATIYKKYEEYLKANHALDFDDLILKVIYIFENNEDILVKWQDKLKHILVDEFQDVDPNQYRLLKLLAGEHNEVSVVGDPDQTIYTWRGADINIILHFEHDFNNAYTISLEENYRSTGKILDVANRLISHNVNRIKKNLFTNNNEGVEIATYNGEFEKKEAEYVVDNINDMYDGKTVLYKDFAILYRNNSQSSMLEEVLMKRGIKYKIYGGIKFYKRAEIKDCICFLRLATNFEDDLAFYRLIENTSRGIGKTTIEKIRDNAIFENKSAFTHLKDHLSELTTIYKPKQGESLVSFIKQISSLHDSLILEESKTAEIFDKYLHDHGYFDMLILAEEDERVQNVHQFISQIKDYFKVEESKLSEFLQNAILMSSQDEIDDIENDDFVKLMTIHTAKGLEFNNVFVYGLVDGIFPSSRTIEDNHDGIEEERRLFYVAITRAKKRLFLTTSGGYSYMGTRLPSRFLKEIKNVARSENLTIKNNDSMIYATPTDIKANQIIRHDIFGKGIVLNEHDGIIDVLFEDSRFGRKSLIANHKFIHKV